MPTPGVYGLPFRAAAWHNIGAPGEPAYENSWAVYSDSNWIPASFRKDENGIVHMQGLVARATTSTLPIFTLPVGYRPSTNIIFATVGTSAFVEIRVLSNGQVHRESGGGGSTWVSLAPIHFRAK